MSAIPLDSSAASPLTADTHATDAKSTLKLLRIRNIGRVIIGYLNINSVRNKFDALKEIAAQSLDVLMIAETKIDPTFPTGQFAIDGFATPFRLDRNANGGGLLVYVRSDIPSHQLKSFKFSDDIECISFEINLRKKKWVLFSVYRPPTQSQDNLFENLGLALDHYSENYDNFMFLGDFNMTETEEKLKHFLDLYSLKNLVKEPTCYKSHTPKCIDLVLTNRDRSVQKTTTVETGLSDFHKMVVTVLKTTFPKQGPTVINYRNYKKYNENVFKSDLREELQRIEPLDLNYSSFETAFDRVLDKHAPIKKKYVRANDKPFMTRALRKATMLRSRLRNKYNEDRTAENWNNFRKQRNSCVKLFRKEKRNYYNNLDISLVTDNKKFWKTVKPFFSDKSQSQNKIVLTEGERIISDDVEVAETMNEFFVTVTDSLGINENFIDENPTDEVTDPVENAVKKFSNHPSILKIKGHYQNAGPFVFQKVAPGTVDKEVKNLNPKKATTHKNIPPKILKSNSDVCVEPLTQIFNDCIENSTFPDELKCADVTSLPKNGPTNTRTNFRPISVLPTVSKLFERILDKQIVAYITPFLSSLLCGFRKGYGAQHALVRLLEKFKISLDEGGKAGAVLMDLSKAFDCIRHDLLIAKLHAYGFSQEALTLINDYLTNRQQRVKVNGSFSSWKDLTRGVPQGSVLGPLLFNIYINDLLLFIQNSDICNYADDTTIYSCDKSLDNITHKLENDCNVALKWFADNFMKLNADKCHLLVLGQRCDDSVTVKIGNTDVVNSSEEKLLGVHIDSKLSFDQHVSKLCQKASNKLYALARISPYMDQNKLRNLMRAFITSQFQYCPLIWMFHSRQLNQKINKIQERALRITYKDTESTYSELLQKDCAVTIHTKNLQILMTEMYKTKNELNPLFMQEIFRENTLFPRYNLRSNNEFTQPRVRSVSNGTESVRFKGPQLWQTLPLTIRNSENLCQFKNKIKNWFGENCTCRLCRIFIPNLGYL